MFVESVSEGRRETPSRNTFGVRNGVSCPELLSWTVRVGGPQVSPVRGTAQCTTVQSIGLTKDLDPTAAALFGYKVLVSQVGFLGMAWPYSPSHHNLYLWLPGQ